MGGQVLRLQDVAVRRDGAALLRGIDWTVNADERWAVIGPNGAGKTTLLQVASTLLYPTEGVVEVLGERLGQADVFDLRPRIGLASAALAERIPPEEKVIDLVLTASYGIMGRWTEEYDSNDVTRAVELIDMMGAAHLIRRRFGTLSEGSASGCRSPARSCPTPRCSCSTSPRPGSTSAVARTWCAAWRCWPATSARRRWSW